MTPLSLTINSPVDWMPTPDIDLADPGSPGSEMQKYVKTCALWAVYAAMECADLLDDDVCISPADFKASTTASAWQRVEVDLHVSDGDHRWGIEPMTESFARRFANSMNLYVGHKPEIEVMVTIITNRSRHSKTIKRVVKSR